MRRKQERKNREDFRDLLIEKIYSNQLNNKVKWRNFVHQIKDDKRFLNLLNQPGSTPFELFED
jgi:pre-mRNA-processing factor 40